MDHIPIGSRRAQRHRDGILREVDIAGTLRGPAHASRLGHRDTGQNIIGSTLVLPAWRAERRFKDDIDLVADCHRGADITPVLGKHRVGMQIIPKPHRDGILGGRGRAPVFRAITIHGEITPQGKALHQKLLSQGHAAGTLMPDRALAGRQRVCLAGSHIHQNIADHECIQAVLQS